MSGAARLPGADGRRDVVFTFDGERIVGKEGDTIAMAAWAASMQVLRNSSRDGTPRGVLCNMGICFECLVVVDGATVRACTTLVRDGMQVRRGGRP